MFCLQKLQDQSSSVDQAKDRAQMTASTATVVVQVALLKDIIVEGDTTPYYLISLVLVVSSISLQILSGLISVCLAQYEAYYQKNEGDICDDVRNNLCWCCCPSRGIEQTLERRCCTCLSLDYTAETSLREFYQWARRFGKNRKNYLGAEVEIDYIKEEIAALRKGLEFAAEKNKKEIQRQMQALKNERRMKKEVLRKQEMDVKMGAFYQKRAENVYRIQVMKKVTMWQQVVNYMLYVIFAINLFITGFGIAK